MKVAIIYASTEGQTRKIAVFAMNRLMDAGHSVALLSADDAIDLALDDFDRVILAASVHTGKYQSEMIEFSKTHSAALQGKSTLFLSVSLAAAGNDKEDWAQLKKIADHFCEETGLAPTRIEHVAGAFRFSDYNFFEYWAMRWIESQQDPGASSGTDREYTDWDGLSALLTGWMAVGGA